MEHFYECPLLNKRISFTYANPLDGWMDRDFIEEI